jgi:transaldolase
LAGSDIQTNPAATNAAVQRLNKHYTRKVDRALPTPALKEIQAEVDVAELERVLMVEGTAKFAEPQRLLLKLIADRRVA